jgi:growth hormone-inducible transmembrane protein
MSAPHSAPSLSVPTSVSQPGGWNRLLINVGIVAGAAFAAQLFFNRPQRDGPLSQYARDYLNSTFMYLAGGLSLTAASAIGLHRAGFSIRLMRTSPWVVLGVGLLASIGGMIGAQTLEPGSPAKYACWALFNLSQAAVLSPLLFFNPALLARAGLYTAGVVGSLCYVGATAKDDAFLWMGGPLLAGVTIV